MVDVVFGSENPMISPPSRCMAVWKDNWVRVEGSKKSVARVFPERSDTAVFFRATGSNPFAFLNTVSTKSMLKPRVVIRSIESHLRGNLIGKKGAHNPFCPWSVGSSTHLFVFG